ncbi:MAG: methylenetetrahydrofolate reductase [Chloroflexi bacterium]|nr:methylenetetrahydrofolate reductase [Chloroflexota bacterium]
MGGWPALLGSDRFLVTVELNPPKGTAVEDTLARAQRLQGLVDAFNVTDSHGSIMTAAPVALAHHLVDHGLEPILQMTCRDRNRIALQADLLAASLLGVESILCLTGDAPGTGDHPDARGVFDLDAPGLLRAASALMGGKDLAGHLLDGVPRFCLGAVVNPNAQDLGQEVARADEKVQAGARFFQSQPVFDPGVSEAFLRRVEHLHVPILAGVLLLKSAGMARRLSQRLPDLRIPEHLIGELERARDPAQAGVAIAARLVRELSATSRGVHLMAPGSEHHIPSVLGLAGLVGRPSRA